MQQGGRGRRALHDDSTTGESSLQNDGGLPLKPVYSVDDRRRSPQGTLEDEPLPGTFPYTRGIHKDMYRGRLWTMRQYAGFGTAAESNKRYRFLLGQGQTGLSVAFDLPTQIGYDSDDPMANGEVGKVGVAIDSLEDMEILLQGIPLAEVSTSMTINATASMLLLLYQLVAEKQGCPPEKITGTVQNDILKEYAARGTYIFPPKPSMRLITDLFAYCAESLPNWNTISISGYHMREAGSTAAEEIALTLSHAIAYVEAAQAAGLAVDDFAPRASFFFACHMDFFEEVAKFRAARRMWARIMRDRFHARDERSQALRFHLGLPSESAAELALRTQQVIGYETAVPYVADPLGGSYYVENLTDRVEEEALAIMAEIDELGGAVACIETGWTQRRIADSAYRMQKRIESGERIVVGVNKYMETDSRPVEIMKVGPRHEVAQARALKKLRARRSRSTVERHLSELERAARGSGNLMPPLKAALADYVTIGECCRVLRGVFGEYQPPGEGVWLSRA